MSLVDDNDIQHLADQAEEGYDQDQLRPRPYDPFDRTDPRTTSTTEQDAALLTPESWCKHCGTRIIPKPNRWLGSHDHDHVHRSEHFYFASCRLPGTMHYATPCTTAEEALKARTHRAMRQNQAALDRLAE